MVFSKFFNPYIPMMITIVSLFPILKPSVFNNIYLIHNELLKPTILTENELKTIQNKSIFSGVNNFKSAKDTYKDIFYFFRNTYLLFFGDHKLYQKNREYLKNIIQQNEIEDTEIKLRISKSRSFEDIDNILFSNRFMKEIIAKTNQVLNKKDPQTIDEYSSLMQYVSGNCWVNDKLSNQLNLDEKDIEMIKNIHSILDKVEPLSFSITLFHGFEPFTYYRNENWKIGTVFQIPGFLSKSLSFSIANRFAQSENYMNCQFLIVKYPKNIKHINLNIRPFDQEFEFLTYSNEKLKIVDIIHILNYPQYLTFYICEYY